MFKSINYGYFYGVRYFIPSILMSLFQSSQSFFRLLHTFLERIFMPSMSIFTPAEQGIAYQDQGSKDRTHVQPIFLLRYSLDNQRSTYLIFAEVKVLQIGESVIAGVGFFRREESLHVFGGEHVHTQVEGLELCPLVLEQLQDSHLGNHAFLFISKQLLSCSSFSFSHDLLLSTFAHPSSPIAVLSMLRDYRLFHPWKGLLMYYAPSSLRLLFSRLSTFRLLHLFSISFFIPSGPIRLFPKRNSVIFSVISAKLALKSIMPLLPIFLPLMSKIVFISSIQPLMISLTLGVITTPLLSSSPPSVCTPTMQYSLSLPSQKIGAPLWPGLVQIRQSTKASDYLGFLAERQSTAEDSPLYYICFLQLSGCSFADFGQPETVSRLLLSPSRKAQRESRPKQPYLFSRLQKFFSLAKAKSQQSASSSPRVTYSLGNLQPLIQNFSPKSFTSLISFPFSLMVTSCCLKPRVKVAESAFFFESRSQKLWAQVRIHYELMRKAVPLKPLFQNWVYKKPIVVYGYSSMGAYFLLSFRGLRRPEQVRQYPRYEFVHYL